jgi:hypothetical protein
MRTTRKRSKYGVTPNNIYRRNRQFEKELPRLHRKLSRIDIEKDAIKLSTDRIDKDHKPYFTKIANELFGTFDLYKKELELFENEIDMSNTDFLDLFESNGPAIFIIKVDPDQIFYPKILSSKNPDGTVVSNPLHEMEPKLTEMQKKEYLPFLTN